MSTETETCAAWLTANEDKAGKPAFLMEEIDKGFIIIMSRIMRPIMSRTDYVNRYPGPVENEKSPSKEET